jgi:hypothetical protein
MKKSVITCFILVLALGGIGLFRVQRVSAQSTTTTEFDLDLHCSGPAPVVGGAQLTLQMSPLIMAQPLQLNCSDSTNRGDTQHFVLDVSSQVISNGRLVPAKAQLFPIPFPLACPLPKYRLGK